MLPRMMLKLMSFAMPLLLHWTVSCGQSSQDTLCYHKDEVKALTIALIEGETCCDNLSLCDQQLDGFVHMVNEKDSIIADMRSIVTIKDQTIDLRTSDMEALESDVKYWKKRSTVTIILASIITVLTLFVAIK